MCKIYCDECGQEMEIMDNGVSHHLDEDGRIDYDQDADHVALCLDEEECE